ISYKDKKSDGDVMAWVHAVLPNANSDTKVGASKMSEMPKWITELAMYEETDKNKNTFKKNLSSDFFSHRIFVFSPNGDVVDLPIDSTPIDFAYSIHSDVGNKMTGAKVNGKLVALDSSLKNGDIVEIMNKENAKPNRKWLEIAKTSTARRHIRHELAKLKDLER
ncbi:MAG: TGS domain-containing protein, partial [Parcubacteria group bacterium]